MIPTYRNLLRTTATLSLAALTVACQVNPIQQKPPASIDSIEAVVQAATSSSRSEVAAEKIPVQTIRSEESAPPETAMKDDNLWQRVATNLQVQQQYEHASIDRELAWYLDHPRYIERIAARAAPFLFEIVDEIEQRGLPMELALLPVVESAFDPNAYSPEHAVGLWQFMPATGRSYGLSADWWYDGRRDPLASTRAALDYLQFLNEKFDGNWLLTFAAYNAGQGNVRRALRRSGQSAKTADFWSLRLPAETRNHIPRLLAISRLIANAAEFDVQLPELANQPYLEVVELDFQLDLTTAAHLARVDESLLRTLNAGYLQWATHPDYPQSLVVPRERAKHFRDAVAELPQERRVAWDNYQIQPGDTLGAIARQFNTRVAVLKSINDLRNSRIIAGDSLLVPSSGQYTGRSPAVAGSLSANASPTPTSYQVKRGDNLWRIARRFDLRSRDIAQWNGIATDSLLHPGQLLSLHPVSYLATVDEKNSEQPATIIYSVVRGDSLDRIARRFRVTVENLVAWNRLEQNGLIFPGQEILVRLPRTKLN